MDAATINVTNVAAISNNKVRLVMRARYSRLTPLASTSLPPTRSRVRNVLAMPDRPLSRNSTRVAWVPTATMSSAPLSSASSIATSSLVPVAGNTTYGTPSCSTRTMPGARPSRYACTTTSAPHVSARSETESMSPTMRCGVHPASRIASAPPSTPMSTGRYSTMYGRRVARSSLYWCPRTTMSTWRPSTSVTISGTPTRSSRSARSRRRKSRVLAANDSIWTASPARALSTAASTWSSSSSTPLATTWSPTQTAPSCTRTYAPSWTAVITSGPTSSTRGIPACTMISGPRFGYRPEMLRAALTTAAGRRATSDSAATTSMSTWSITATSPGSSRFVRFLVRRSMRAGPMTPGPPSGAARRRVRNILTRRWSHGAIDGRSAARPAPCPPGLPVAHGAGSPLHLGGGEELPGVRLRGAGVLHPAEHPRELADPPRLVQRRHAAHRHLAVAGLHHREVTVRGRGALRQVGDDDHLRGPGEPGQPAADAERRPAAHPRVDLVEDERRHGVGCAEHDLEPEHEAGQLSARRALGDRPGRRAGMRHEQELDLVDPVRARRAQ